MAREVKKAKLKKLRQFVELYLEQCLVALNGAPFLP